MKYNEYSKYISAFIKEENGEGAGKNYVRFPLAYVDIDNFDYNANVIFQDLQKERLKRQYNAKDFTIRLATKSFRCVPLMKRLFAISEKYDAPEFPILKGLMCFDLEEAIWLKYHKSFVGSILVAYPSFNKHFIKQLIEYQCQIPRIHKSEMDGTKSLDDRMISDEAWGFANKETDKVILCVDSVESATLLNSIAKDLVEEIQKTRGITLNEDVYSIHVSIDTDTSTEYLFGILHFGVYRSPTNNKQKMKQLIEHIAQDCKYLRISGIISYEAQIAGLSDYNRPFSSPFERIKTFIIGILKYFSWKAVLSTRNEIIPFAVKLLSSHYNATYPMIVNGGGSGSFQLTVSDPTVTEITVGSAFYYPHFFQYQKYISQNLKNSVGFILEVTRKYNDNIYVCNGGGYIASGSIGIEKYPVICYPNNTNFIENEGFGEVQTPIQTKHKLQLGDYVYCQHTKAGELCERFNDLFIIRNSASAKSSPSTPIYLLTYRGEGKCFM